MVVSGGFSWNFVDVKMLPSKLSGRLTAAEAADIEVRQLRATAKRIGSDRKSILRILAATGMYTATGKLKAQFR